MSLEDFKYQVKKITVESRGHVFNSELKTDEQQCPICGKTYKLEISKDDFNKKLGTKDQREQHLSGICSEDCWDSFFFKEDDEDDYDYRDGDNNDS